MTRTNPQPCPHLPRPDERRPAASLAPFRGKRKGVEFYLTALECAQSRWLECLPAQAILMINRSLTVDFSSWTEAERVQLGRIPFPYQALEFIIREGGKFGFIGNPRRHFQHLATRMSGPNPELRIARAWACWAIARSANPQLIADEVQLTNEGITEPHIDEISSKLAAETIDAEHRAWTEVIDSKPKA